MKRFLLLFFGILIMHVSAQEVKTQKDILQLPNTDLVKDFNLKVGKGGIKPIEVSKSTYSDYGYGRVGHKFAYLVGDFQNETLTFDADFLIKKVNEFKFGTNFLKPKSFDFNYTYNNGFLKTQNSNSVYNGKIESSEETIYDFDTKGSLKEIKQSSQGKTVVTKYISDNNSIKTDFENGKHTYEIKDGLVTKKITYNKSANKTYTDTYKYNNDGFLEFEDKGTYEYSYQLNNKNLIEKEVDKDLMTRHYKYIYDKYGNWVISYHLATSDKDYDGNKTKTHLYGVEFSFYIRAIKYSNGITTGSINLEDGKTKALVIKLRNELYSSLIESDVSYSKTTNSSYLFKIDNQQEAKNTSSVFMGNSLLVFHKPSSQLYVLEDFGNKPEGTDFPAKKVSINIENGYWFKTEKGGVHVFRSDGSYINNHEIYKLAANNKDVIYKGENEPNQVVLEQYSTIDELTPYPVTLYSEYSEKRVDNMTDNAKKLKDSMEKYHLALLGNCVNGDCKEGYGEQELKDGRKAEGFFKNGKPYGPMHISNKKTGESTLSNYDGSFEYFTGFMYNYNGTNTMMFSDASKNLGFYNDYKTKKTYQFNYNGYGKIISKTELSYNSNSKCVVGNCTNGIGIYEYDNSTYMGTFKNGIREGFGYLFFKNGNNYIGEFTNGTYHGLGTFTTSEFDYSMGFYKNGKMHGEGIKYDSKNNYRAGTWSNGELKNHASDSSTNTTNTAIINSKNTTSNYHLSEVQTNRILACKEDSKCIARYFTELYVEERKTLSGDVLIKKTTDYFHSFYNMNPKLAFNTLFKMDLTLIDIKLLPQSVQDDLKKRAQKVREGYQEHIKSQGY